MGSLETYLTWAEIPSERMWIHANGKVKIDQVMYVYVVSYRRLGAKGYYWDALWISETLYDAKIMGESGFNSLKTGAQ